MLMPDSGETTSFAVQGLTMLYSYFTYSGYYCFARCHDQTLYNCHCDIPRASSTASPTTAEPTMVTEETKENANPKNCRKV